MFGCDFADLLALIKPYFVNRGFKSVFKVVLSLGVARNAFDLGATVWEGSRLFLSSEKLNPLLNIYHIILVSNKYCLFSKSRNSC